jgi:hypothetical protein
MNQTLRILPHFAAAFSRIASGDSTNGIAPLLVSLILIVVSWYFRPADRKIMSGTCAMLLILPALAGNQ